MRILASTKSVPVELEFADGSVRSLLLKEFSADQSDSWANYLNARIQEGSGNQSGVKAECISRCLYDPEKAAYVTKDEILKLSSTAQNVLKEMCDDLNGYTIDSLDKAKKRLDAEKKN